LIAAMPLSSSLPSPFSPELTAWSWRVVSSPADDSFLDELYASTRLAEVQSWGFAADEAASFLRDQARLQRQSHALHFPAAEHRVLLAAGVAAGRIIVSDHDASVTLIVDLSVLPQARRRGLATWAVSAVLDRARANGRQVELRVEPHNAARRLYERLGFRALARDELRVHMGWRAAC
jgi:ribosomal protein S18 acetylase RimI-like enzyme